MSRHHKQNAFVTAMGYLSCGSQIISRVRRKVTSRLGFGSQTSRSQFDFDTQRLMYIEFAVVEDSCWTGMVMMGNTVILQDSVDSMGITWEWK